VIVITNSYLNYSWKKWIGIIFNLFSTVCKYGVSTLQYTFQNMVEIPSKFPLGFCSFLFWWEEEFELVDDLESEVSSCIVKSRP
jgi:hypothetical protein